MIYRTLGRTGAKVSAIALGCEGFVGKTQDEAREMVDYAASISLMSIHPIRACVQHSETHFWDGVRTL